jgi:hypothetical protein
MTNEDRDMLVSLHRQHADLQQMLERLTSQLAALEARTGYSALEFLLPPLPPEAFLPPIPHPVDLPPIPLTSGELPPIPSLPAAPAAAPVPAESHFSRWVMRLGAAFAILFVALLAGTLDLNFHLDRHLGLLGRFGMVGLASTVVLFIGERFDRGAGHSFFGRLLLVTGLLGLYLSFYEAFRLAITSRVPHPYLGGYLLLTWTFYALFLAERRKSHLVGVIGILLAYFSMNLVPDPWFTMAMNLFLTCVAAAFLMWRGWTTLASLSVIGTYFALFHHLLFNSYGDFVLDTSRDLPFLPPAVYLGGAWLIFTAAIILCTVPTFRAGRRFFLTSLNNAGLAILLPLSAYISGYGLASIGWTLLDTGVVFLIVSRFAGFAEYDPVELMGTYAAQGLALFTAGVVVVFTGITRALVLLLETLLLGIAGAFARDRVLITATYAAGFFATIFSIWQIAIWAHHPWLLGFGGALIMLINAWARRGEVRHSPIARSHTVFSTCCYCLLALGLIFAALSSELTDASLPVALALGAIILTFAIYHFSIFELPSLAQILMLAALVLVLFPVETGEELPWWSVSAVALATLVLLTWWARQRVTLPGAWIGPVSYLYAFALVYLAVLTIRPYCQGEGWLVTEALLAVIFLAYAALVRVWPLGIAGQILLVFALAHVFFPPQRDAYPWSAMGTALPILVTYFVGRAIHRWLHLFPELSGDTRALAGFFGNVYKFVALIGVIYWTFVFVPPATQMAAFFFLGSFLFAANIRQADSLGIRSAALLSVIGLYLCTNHAAPMATALNAFAVLLFIAQTPLLVAAPPMILSRFESWVLTLGAIFTGWYFISVCTWPAAPAHSYVSVAWGLFALLLFLLGLFGGQGRLLWCGLIVLCAAILRVLCLDLWTLSPALRVLTLFLLVIVGLGVGLSFALGSVLAPENRTKNV